MIRNEIEEYPYTGTVYRVIPGQGDDDDTKVVIYQGRMDEHMISRENGDTMSTASYIISMPLEQCDCGGYHYPIRGDEIVIDVYGTTISLIVDNAEPSQLGGVSVYATRNSW